ncbi:hypothetical protein D1818_23135 [Aquimarina sp. BL5]|uniref:hypothetical protein n=1 Tax=Aquimarina sp. BL5 TaxID=1714860 RepID=UPI000E4AAD09|nr:hypothetical protein [Aquimarina sp. BL5]AXT53577.1 hypothetical protein D1818_23135 [Aquimarina sp. BL5]RKM94202.1 hypothetical protein D7036_21955 [Aquimarina sp. BL5]
MKAATVRELKLELNNCSQQELVALCLRLSKFKKENKELLTYLLYEVSNEDNYIEEVREEITKEFSLINTSSYYYIKKSVRKILRVSKKYIRYSGKKETEVEILLHFCSELKNMRPSIRNNNVLLGIYERQIASIKKTIITLHEDLQYDYEQMLDALG